MGKMHRKKAWKAGSKDESTDFRTPRSTQKAQTRRDDLGETLGALNIGKRDPVAVLHPKYIHFINAIPQSQRSFGHMKKLTELPGFVRLEEITAVEFKAHFATPTAARKAMETYVYEVEQKGGMGIGHVMPKGTSYLDNAK